jgi:serine/threonine protein phosphatase PrpC
VIPSERSHLTVTVTSHPGMSGKNNEDRYGVSAFRLESEPGLPSILAVVADGIGGHRAGEVAAEMAVETISQIVAESDASQPVQILERAIIQAGESIAVEAEANPQQKGMGSTCACAWVIGKRLYTASVGDSRIYLIRKDNIQRLTTDHTWVQEAIDQGVLNPEQARNHPNAHVIRRHLGSRSEVVPDLRLRLQPGEDDVRALANQGTLLQMGDMLLLCSDGLTDLVDDEEILAALSKPGVEEALLELVHLANQRGGHDNITIVTLGVPALEAPTIPIAAQRTRSRWALAAAAMGLLVLFGLVVLGGIYWYSNRPAGNPTSPAVLPGGKTTLFPAPARTHAPGAAATPLNTALATPQPRTALTPLPTSGSAAATLTPWPTNTQNSPP